MEQCQVIIRMETTQIESYFHQTERRTPGDYILNVKGKSINLQETKQQFSLAAREKSPWHKMYQTYRRERLMQYIKIKCFS